ncbi:MAG: hypothetical protein DRH06_09845 [Deltaproteobacteria bacterium]|nr:MAG: hypothetical protein DRH06_09845 [Deltaproteobacteria bacterium]
MSLCIRPVDLRKLGWQPTDQEAVAKEAGFTCGDGALRMPLKDLTTVDVSGSGVFDVLMRASKAHLAEEYDAGRITGNDYSTVYLGVMVGVLQTSVQFLMNEQQSNQIAAEVALIHQKIVTELSETDDTIPVGLGFNYIPEEGSSCIDPIVCPLPNFPDLNAPAEGE